MEVGRGGQAVMGPQPGAFSKPEDVGVVPVRVVGTSEPLQTYVATLPDGPVLMLEGPASVIWWEALEAASLDDLVRRVAETYDLTVDDVRTDVEAFVSDLSVRGLLIHTSRE